MNLKLQWMDVRALLHRFVLPKLRFAGTSLVATVIDYTLYLTLVYSGIDKVPSNICSASCGFLVNFFLQKKFIFTLKRKVHATFLMSMSFSVLGIGVSTLLIYLISMIPFFDRFQFITKLVVTGIMFFYNYYTKRIAFERR